MADQPDRLENVLAQLEARKQSLRSRLENLDTAIDGLHGLEGLNKAEEILAGPEVMPPLTVQEQPQMLKALTRPLPVASVERPQPAHLNVYVNLNSEWASRQFVAPDSPRAIFRRKAGHRCPKCGSQDTRISLSRGIADRLMFLFDYSRARCRSCDTRFRIWRSREEDDQQHEPEAHSPAD